MSLLKSTLILFTTSLILGCGGGGDSTGNSSSNESSSTSSTTTTTSTDSSTTNDTSDDSDDSALDVDNTYFIELTDHEEPSDIIWNSEDEILIELLGDNINSSSADILYENSIVSINIPGTFRISGPLYDGQIKVEVSDEEIVRLVLDGVNISNSTSAAINVVNSAKTIIILEENTLNYLSDAMVYEYEGEEDEPNATIFSKDDLTLYGKGSLTVEAKYNDGIASKDGLVISGTNITVNSVDDGIRGKDYLVVRESSLTITSVGDGLKSTEDEEDKGLIIIESGSINIVSSAGDAIQAESNIQISGGSFDLVSGGGSNLYSGSESFKGLKAKVNIFISDGNFTINSSDDAVHSNNGITINGGVFAIETGDDAFHADSNLTVNAGEISVTKSYEGFESAVINITGGNNYLTTSDDGINIAGGNDGSGGFNANVNSDQYLNITGGYTVVYASGDGLDSNSNILMSGGTMLVHGPTANNNGALDFDGSFELTGGLLVAVGSSGMAQVPSSISSQLYFAVNFGGNLEANKIFNIQSDSGDELLTFVGKKNYATMIFSSPALESSVDYKAYTEGSSTGLINGGLYSGGEYSKGELLFEFSISSDSATSIN